MKKSLLVLGTSFALASAVQAVCPSTDDAAAKLAGLVTVSVAADEAVAQAFQEVATSAYINNSYKASTSISPLTVTETTDSTGATKCEYSNSRQVHVLTVYPGSPTPPPGAKKARR